MQASLVLKDVQFSEMRPYGDAALSHVPGSKSFASCLNTTDSGSLANKNLSDRSLYGGAGIVVLALVALGSGNGGFCLAVGSSVHRHDG
jgi:hypothetical protein